MSGTSNEQSEGEKKTVEQPLEGQIGYKGPVFLRKLAVMVGGNGE